MHKGEELLFPPDRTGSGLEGARRPSSPWPTFLFRWPVGPLSFYLYFFSFFSAGGKGRLSLPSRHPVRVLFHLKLLSAPPLSSPTLAV